MVDESEERDRCERWFVSRGLPHLIADYSPTDDVLTRAAPFLVFVVMVEVFLSFGDRWNGFAQALAFGAGLALVVGGFAVVNRLRGRRPFRLPDDVGGFEIALYFLLPAIPVAIGAEGSVLLAVSVLSAVNLAILAIAYVVTSWALLPMFRVSVRQARVQLEHVFALTLKSLPILLLFSAFIFLNAEMWQVANDLTTPLFILVMVLIVGVGSAFVAVSVRRVTVDLARFGSWGAVAERCGGTPVDDIVPGDDEPAPDTPPLGRRAVWNVGLLLFTAQGVQILLVALVIAGFYVMFGLLTVREDTVLQWTTATEITSSDWAVRLDLFGSQLLFSRQLVFVAAFIGCLSGLQFAVQLVTDDTYRSDFADDMTEEIREALAVRAVYHRRMVEPDAA